MYKITKWKLSLAMLLFVTYSCSKDNGTVGINDSSQNGVSFRLAEAEFGVVDAPVTKASLKEAVSKPYIVTQEMQSGPFTITAELSEDAPTGTILAKTASSSERGRAATTLLSNRGAVKYRIVAYEIDGTYIDQSVGDASDPNQVFFGDKLIKGHKYTFVIYSLGSTTVNPPAAPTANMNAGGDVSKGISLSLAGLSEQEADFMYAIEKDVTIIGDGTPTPLLTPLKHMFTRVKVLIDNSDATGVFGSAGYQKGGYVSEIPVSGFWSSTFTYGNLSIDPSTGKYMSGGTAFGSPSISNISTTPQTFIINQGMEANCQVNFTIDPNKIKIGNDINAMAANFNFDNSGSGLKPGYSYTLKLRFNSDRYVNASNVTRNANASDALYAVIGGYRWDRYNLGVASTNPATNNPDANPIVAALHGKFYQWGRRAAAADAVTSGDGPIAGWNTVLAPDGAWNSGTTAKPVRTANDPCATGTRVPSRMELKKLVGNTNQTNTGPWRPVSDLTTTDYSVAKVLTSKKSKDIVLTFPAAGWRTSGDGSSRARASFVWYWSSEGWDRLAAYMHRFYNSGSGSDEVTYFRGAGSSVRCIQDKSL